MPISNDEQIRPLSVQITLRQKGSEIVSKRVPVYVSTFLSEYFSNNSTRYFSTGMVHDNSTYICSIALGLASNVAPPWTSAVVTGDCWPQPFNVTINAESANTFIAGAYENTPSDDGTDDTSTDDTSTVGT